MMPQREGIILNSSEQWDEIKQDYDPEWAANGELKPAWRPIGPMPKHKRMLSRITTSLSHLPRVLPAPEKLRPTAYLDGLRGFAALLVYWHHHQLWAHGTAGLNGYFENGFGYEGKFSWVAFPVIRHFFTGGHFSVATFFIISGYVLSLKPMSLIHAGDHGKLGDTVSSAMFRRWPRLYIPLIVVMLAYAMTWHITGMWVNGAKPAGNWRDEAWAFYLEFKNFSFVYKEGGLPWLSYNFHLWSIPVEFKGSMVVYVAQLALSRCSRKARLLCEVGLIWYFMFVADGWFCAMFIQGMLLCDLELLAKKGELPNFIARLEPVKDFIYAHMFVIAMYLGGIPSQTTEVSQLAKNRGWYYLSWFKPQAVFDYKWFYLWIAATFLVVSIPRLPLLKRFFETRFCQFLGRVSFALYMVHGPVLWTIGDRLYMAAGWFTDEHMKHIAHWANALHLPRVGPLGLEVSFLVPQIVLLPLTLLIAEFVTRAVDTPTVDFAAWLYRKTLGPEPLPVKQAKA
ncbi:O-acetyltransferase PaAT-1 [Cladobotryum mycophilum]|uniref:O-acetyltransferase PaAT-1 n=1 Tax=Cladobotryum mycophilum TaxID=491253 RepID=A0ABR0SKM7_9HYPO